MQQKQVRLNELKLQVEHKKLQYSNTSAASKEPLNAAFTVKEDDQDQTREPARLKCWKSKTICIKKVSSLKRLNQIKCSELSEA